MSYRFSAARLRHLIGALSFATACTFGTSSLAQTSTPADMTTPDVERTRGPIAGSTRFIGLGGAFVSLADDTEGVAINPASPALRLPYSWSKWDYGFGVDFSVGAWLPKNDLYNGAGSQNGGKTSALFGSLAAIVYYDYAGVGVSAEAQSNAASRPDRAQGIDTSLAGNFGLVHASLAYGFLRGELLVGAGARLVGASFGSGGPLSAAGVGYEAGVLYKPTAEQYRLAVTYKSAIDAATSGAATNHVHVPWDLAFGFAYQLGVRRLNPAFVTAKDLARAASPGTEPSKAEIERAEHELFRRYERMQRRYLLISAQVSLTESDGDHVGVERFWSGTEYVAPQPVVSPRLGVESEVIAHHLRLRGGSYYEAGRRGMSPARVHGTGGADIRLFEWDVFGLVKPFDWWRLSLGADVARAYLNTSISIGFWH